MNPMIDPDVFLNSLKLVRKSIKGSGSLAENQPLATVTQRSASETTLFSSNVVRPQLAKASNSGAGFLRNS